MAGVAVIFLGLVNLAGLLDLILNRFHIGLVLYLFLDRQSHRLGCHKALPLGHRDRILTDVHLLDEQRTGFRVQRIGACLAGLRRELHLEILPQHRQPAVRVHHGNAHTLLHGGGFNLQPNRCLGGLRRGGGFRHTAYRRNHRLAHTHRNGRTVVGCIHRSKRNACTAAHGYRQRAAQSNQRFAQRHAGKLTARKIAGKIPFVHSYDPFPFSCILINFLVL